MRWSLVVALVIVLAPSLGTGAPPGPPQERHFTLEAIAVACPDVRSDGICLQYGQLSPLLDVNLGDTIVVTLVNRIADTLSAVPGDADLKARLAQSPVSFHVHGTAIAASMDGVDSHVGTQLVASYAAPGDSFTYRFRAAYPGAWHFHDHVMGHDGAEGAARGLYGSLVVRSGGEPRPHVVLDLHLDDAGAHGGRGLDASVAAGARFELLVVGLGNQLWHVTFEDPQGLVVGTVDLGPGISERIAVASASPGVYKWRAVGLFTTHTGEVVVS